MRTIITALLFAGTAASPALAQDKAPFTGAHVEALGAYDNVEGEDAFAYGIGAGFDFQAGGAIIGAEGEYMDSTARDRSPNFLVAGDRFTQSAGRDFYAGVRVGAEVSPGTLLYAKGGYTNARLRTNYDNGAGIVTKGGTNFDGYRLGVGIEKKFKLFGPSGFVKAEYRYSNYKNANIGGANVDVDFDRHQGLIGLGVRF